MGNLTLRRSFALALLAVVLQGCTTYQTAYFRNSYQELAKSDDALLLPHARPPAFTLVDDMAGKARAMHEEGFAMLGYSQFVSPLFTSLAESYSTKWGAEVGAAHVVLETPRPGASNLHYYLVTYWGRLDPEAYGLGVNWQDLPEELLERIGKDKNLVIVLHVIPGTPAAAAGLRAGDVIVALDGELVGSTQALSQRISEREGEAAVLAVSRKGDSLELPVRFATPQRRSGARLAGYRETPWLNTPPTDWSSLSFASFMASSMAVTFQRMEHERQLDYERARAQAQRNLDRSSAQPAEPVSTSRRGAGRPGYETGVVTSRRGAGIPGYDTPRPGPHALSPQAQQEMWKRMQDFGKSWGEKMDRQRQQSVMFWLENAPNVYGTGWGKYRPRPY